MWNSKKATGIIIVCMISTIIIADKFFFSLSEWLLSIGLICFFIALIILSLSICIVSITTILEAIARYKHYRKNGQPLREPFSITMVLVELIARHRNGGNK